MQAMYGSYYKNRIKEDELINNIIKDSDLRQVYIDSWKKQFRKT